MTETSLTPASFDYSGLRALFINCTLKRGPEISNTQGVIDLSVNLMREQGVYYGKVGGAIITGNEDGVKHCTSNLLYSLQHIGYTIPPAADSGWIGEIGPGPSYLDPGSGGPENDFTNRNTTFMTWNLMHLAAILKASGGIPAYGNLRKEWDRGERFGFEPNPEYR